MVAGGGLYSYSKHKGDKTDKEKKIVRLKLSFMHSKRFNRLFQKWVQFHVHKRNGLFIGPDKGLRRDFLFNEMWHILLIMYGKFD